MNDKTKPNPEDSYEKFVSTTGEPILIALTAGGHTASVGVEPTPLHPRFHRAAVMKGAMPAAIARSVTYETDKASTASTKSDRLQVILTEMVAESADDEDKRRQLFTGDGKPDARVMAQRAGFTVTANERDEAWAQFCAGDED